MIRSHAFHPSLVREYDFRGVVGPALGPADAYAVGRGFGSRVVRAGGRRVAVGYDGRLSSPELEAALVEGLLDAGCDAVRIGLGPSPMLYFAEAAGGVDAGVQVTASHNPADHNGFKLVLGHAPFFGDDLQALAREAAAGDWENGARGSAEEADGLEPYAAHLAGEYRAACGDRRFRMAWDAGNGAAGRVLERLLPGLPGEHELLFGEVDGRFPNHHPDPSVDANLADLREAVLAGRYDLGVALDGDGDRLGAVDGRGRPLRGDAILALLAGPALARWPGAAIVADVKSGGVFLDRVRELGGRPVIGRSGHSHTRARVAAEGAPLGGELSGHVFLERGYDDGLLAAVRLAGAVAADAGAGGTLADMADALPAYVSTPELRLPVPDERRGAAVAEVAARLEAAGADVSRLDGARVTGADGWWLLRASNTEPALTARAEARDAAGLARLVAELRGQLALSGVALPD